jgi:selenocysteine-specific elongation factor
MLGDTSVSALKSRSLVHFHTGTTELVGRIIIYGRDELKSGDRAYCQLRFKSPIAVMAGDRYIVRKFSPLVTIGGGSILDTTPGRRRIDERVRDLEILEQGGLKEKLSLKIRQSGLNGMTQDELIGWIKAEIPDIRTEVNALIKDGLAISCEGRLIHKEAVDDFFKKAVSAVSSFHKANPLRPGMSKEDLRAVFRGVEQKLFEAMLDRVDQIVIEKELLRLKTFRISLSEDKKVIKDKIMKVLEQAEFQPPSKDELAVAVSIKPQETGELLKIMASEKSLVRINDSLYIPMSNYTKMIEDLQKFFSLKSEMTVGEFRDILKTSRKYALPFLEYLDSNKITLRVGEVRKFLKKQT